jgi:exosortase/archaeosortase family protein
VAGQMFLKSGWRRWVFTLAVIPLALLRNGFRVLTLGVLCERIGPHMINHWIHHRGGPIFFALSLIPFFVLLIVLARIRRNPWPDPTEVNH